MAEVLRELSLFSGYGGFSLGLKLTGLNTRTVMYVEWAKYPQEIIKARIKDEVLDDAPIWADISTLDGSQLRGMVDVITAGFPCQPHSLANKERKGEEDKRNLWPETLRIISQVEPRYVLLENVAGILASSKELPAYGGTVVGELAQAGYSVRWEVMGADDVGAPHRRKRWLCIGVANGESILVDDAEHIRFPRAQEPEGFGSRIHASTRAYQSQQPERSSVCLYGRESLADSDGNSVQGVESESQPSEYQRPVGLPSRANGQSIPVWPPRPYDRDGWDSVLANSPELAPAIDKETERFVYGMVDGFTHRVDRLKATGNGVIPGVVAAFLR
jgi:DNA (cytosine-5)-methyltransferase 1